MENQASGPVRRMSLRKSLTNKLEAQMSSMSKHAIDRDIPVYREALPEYLESEIG